MKNTTDNQKTRSPDITATYIRLLNGATPTQPEWQLAAELIEAGMAKGTVHRSSSSANYRQVDALLAFAPTLQGRLFAAQLEEQARSRRLSARLVRGLFALGGAIAGFFVGALSGLLTEAMKRALGW